MVPMLSNERLRSYTPSNLVIVFGTPKVYNLNKVVKVKQKINKQKNLIGE